MRGRNLNGMLSVYSVRSAEQYESAERGVEIMGMDGWGPMPLYGGDAGDKRRRVRPVFVGLLAVTFFIGAAVLFIERPSLQRQPSEHSRLTIPAGEPQSSPDNMVVSAISQVRNL